MLTSGDESARRKLTPFVLLLFVGSGFAALIYEVVWLQLLQFVIGSSAVSLGVLLGTYMGGMCLGSLLFPRLVRPGLHPLRVYGLIELGIAACGVAVWFGVPLAGGIYTSAAGYGMPSILLRGFICALSLLAPTMLMGATLPALARWVETTPSGISWLGYFYGGNIAGAVAGSLTAGFYLLRVYDMATATFVAAAVNATVAIASFVLASVAGEAPAAAGPAELPAGLGRPGAAHAVIALSGLTALAAEVVWTRMLSLMLGATVYTFSIILAVFLAGLGLGSAGGAAVARVTRRARFWLGACQLLLAAAIAWTALALTRSLPFWPVNPMLAASFWHVFQLDLVRTIYAVFPPTVLWGASFPLAMAAAARPGQDPGRLVGGVYAANTAGAIAGAVGASLLLIPRLGSQNAQRLLIAAAALAGLAALAPVLRPAPGAGRARRSTTALRFTVAAALLGGFVALLSQSAAPAPWKVVAYGRNAAATDPGVQPLYVGEGMNASIAVTLWTDGHRLFHVSGKVEASSEPQDMRLQRMLAHIPALAHPRPRSVLVVGHGAGVTAGTFLAYPEMERIVICEIEPLVPKVADRYFSAENGAVARDRRVRFIYDDARHYLLTAGEKFDVITSDPIHPWVKGTASLYSREYFDLCRRRLNPGGVISQWAPLYESDVDTVRSELATFFRVFPRGTIWSNDLDGDGYDVVLLGQDGPITIDADAMEQRLRRPDHKAVAASLSQVGFDSAMDLLGAYAGYAPDLEGWLRGAQINTDRNLRLQYMAGRGLNNRRSGEIFNEMLFYRRFPHEVLQVSPERESLLRRLMRMP